MNHFADASHLANGAVSYLRITNVQGVVNCSFLIGKSRLSPLKLLTIPCLELSAAVEAARLDKMVRSEIDIEVNNECYCMDSLLPS